METIIQKGRFYRGPARHGRAVPLDVAVPGIFEITARTELNIVHGNIDTGLSDYGDLSFDYVIFDQGLQQVRKTGLVINEALRVEGNVIVASQILPLHQRAAADFFRENAGHSIVALRMA